MILRRADRRKLALTASFALGFVMLAGRDALAHPATTPANAPFELLVFGPELPFMFETRGARLDFAWSDLIALGNTAVGTISMGGGEVIGIDDEFFVADSSNPTPRKISSELTPTGVVATFKPAWAFSLPSALDLKALQQALDTRFGDVETFVYLFRADVVLLSVEYQLSGPRPSKAVVETIEAGNSQEAARLGTKKYVKQNIKGTLVGIRAPAYLNTVFEIPYHIHFIADDRSVLGHVTELRAEDLEISWARIDALRLRYWNTE